MRLQGKVAVVTGGARGIGKAISQAFAAEGAKVALVYRGSKDAADALVSEIAGKGGEAKAYQCDAADRTAVNHCVETILKDFGQIDVLVNNAGVVKDSLFLRMEPENWDLVLTTNLGGTYNFTKPIVEAMFRNRKGAINAFTKALAVEVASRGINVNAIAPGFIETDMSETVRNLAGDTIKNAIPMKRYGKPEDIAKVAVFLAGDESAYMTGQVITVDGGLGLGAMSG